VLLYGRGRRDLVEIIEHNYALIDVFEVWKGLLNLFKADFLIASLLYKLHQLVRQVCPALPLTHSH